jgi:hypothetical protein
MDLRTQMTTTATSGTEDPCRRSASCNSLFVVGSFGGNGLGNPVLEAEGDIH